MRNFIILCKPEKNIVEKRKPSELYRSHSCRKPETITRLVTITIIAATQIECFRRRLSRGQPGSTENVLTPADEMESLDIVDENLNNVTISLKCQKGFSVRPVPSI